MRFDTVSAEETAETEATETAVTQESFSVGMALPFTMLEAYLYAMTGQQAYDTYYENEENQEALHKDFCDFISDTSTGIEMNMKINGMMVNMTMDKFIEYYKINGSSALAGASEKASNNFKVITGGSNSNNEDDNNNGYDDKNVKLISASSVLLTGKIGEYIGELVKGNRGEVSETFANSGQEIPKMYFDGDYNIIDNDLYFEYTGYWYFDAVYLASCRGNGLLKMYVEDIAIEENSRFALLLNNVDFNMETNWMCYVGEEDVPVYNPFIYFVQNGDISRMPLKVISDISDGSGYHRNGHEYPYFDLNSVAQFNSIPVFNTKSLMKHYLETGDASGALNNFEKADIKENYYNYDFSQISDNLKDILKAFATLPLITTESLAGFAQGVNEQVAGQTNPSSTPQEQEDAVKRAMEDNSKRTATEQLAGETNKTAEELAEELETTPVPSPTATPEEQVTKKQAQMIVDLHDFFPFCVPYDLVHLIKVLNAKPVAPCFETAIVYEPLNINVPIKLDLAQFEDVAEVFRITETALFILALILVSRSLIRG